MLYIGVLTLSNECPFMSSVNNHCNFKSCVVCE
jgi:hypothetical protein